MARPFKLEISESEEYLAKSLKNARTASSKERLQMLWWLKTEQVTEHQELSQPLGTGCPCSTVLGEFGSNISGG